MADTATTMAMRLESKAFKGMQLPLIVSVVCIAATFYA